jgi:uncharacterized DUF497 family protein
MTRNRSSPRFEFDERKSRLNKLKHGIDFMEAQGLWLDERAVETAARSDVEARFVVVGLISGRHWSAFITYRGEVVRLISARRSREEEVAIYEGQ